MLQSRWSVYSGWARAAPAYTRHAPQRLPSTLSKRPSFGKHFRVTLYHTECAPQPLKRTLSVRRSRWIVHWVRAAAAELVTLAYTVCEQKHVYAWPCKYMTIHIHDNVCSWICTFITMHVRLWPCPSMTIYNCACTCTSMYTFMSLHVHVHIYICSCT